MNMNMNASASHEQLIDTIDLRQLRSGIRWMIMRPFAPRFVEEVELGRYVRGLLQTRRWSLVRVAPHLDAQGVPSAHVFDVYGVPAEAGIRFRQGSPAPTATQQPNRSGAGSPTHTSTR